MQRFAASEEDDDEMGMDVKEEDEDDDDDDDEEKNMDTPTVVGVDVGMVSTSSNKRFLEHHLCQDQPTPQGGGSRRCRPQEEKERTKLRERQRRAITAKILAGLRRHGNYNLRVRADINDVIAALSQEAGWVVLPDGTTFPSRSQVARPTAAPSATVTSSSTHMPVQHTSPPSLRGMPPDHQKSANHNASHMKGVFLPTSSPYDVSPVDRSQTSAIIGDGGEMHNDPLLGGPINTVDNRQVVDIPTKLQEHDFAGTPHVPVYVMLPLGVINMKCELVDPDGLVKQLKVLKSIDADGVMVDCWWGVVEAHAPQEYNWNGYKMLFKILQELKMKLRGRSERISFTLLLCMDMDDEIPDSAQILIFTGWSHLLVSG